MMNLLGIFFSGGSYALNDDPDFNFQPSRVIQWHEGRRGDLYRRDGDEA